MSRLALLTTLLALLGAGIAAPADAGTYNVHSCRAPDGSKAPADGWRSFRLTPDSWNANNCASAGGLSASLDGDTWHTSNVSQVGWEFSSGRTIAAWNVELTTNNSQTWVGASADVWAARSERVFNGDNVVFTCAAYAGCTGARSHSFGETNPPPTMRKLHLIAMCGGVAGYSCAPVARATTSEFTLRRASFTLVDDVAPTASAVAGTLLEGNDLTGAQGVSFVASDPDEPVAPGGSTTPGSGVRRAELEIGGLVVDRFTAPDVRRCPLEGSDFQHLQPCPSSVPVELQLDANKLRPGNHVMRVRVIDAAGNSSTVVGPRTIAVADATVKPFVAAKPASRLQLRAFRQRVKAYGRMLLSGRLRTPRLARGALVEIQLRSGRGWRTIAVRRTNTTGTFRFRHRFRRTADATLTFRARVRPDVDLPVRPLPSRAVRIRVG